MKTTQLLFFALFVALALPERAWPVLSEGKVGPTPAADATVNVLRQGRDATLVTQQAHAKYQEMTLRGNSYFCANAAGTPVTTVAGLSPIAPALTLFNPAGSGKNLVLNTVTLDVTTSPGAAAAFSLAYNTITSSSTLGFITTTNATIQNNNLGNLAVPTAQCYRVATGNFTPTAFRYIGGTTGASGIGAVQWIDHVDGEVIIPPGVAISIQSTSAAAIVASFSWEEVAI